jgi:hypothetical protein
VTNALGHCGDGAARAAIREVAAWLRSGDAGAGHAWELVAVLLEQQVGPMNTNREKTVLLSINQARSQGISRLRKPIWANPMDHILCGFPRIKLYCPANRSCNGRDPVDVLFQELDLDAQVYEPYSGPLPDSDEYQAEAARFDALEADL